MLWSKKKRGQAIIEFAISSVFIIVFAFVVVRVARWMLQCLREREASYYGGRVSAGRGGSPGFSASSKVDLIN